jgi:polysaccharide chain length determinant protein (PEP-CTERM system associated)
MPYDPMSTSDVPLLPRLLEILRRRAVPAAAVFAAVVVSATAFARYLPNLFRSNAVVLVERRLPENFVRPVEGDDVETRLHVIKQQILGRAQVTELVRRFDLYSDLTAAGDIDSVIDQVRKDIGIELTGPEQVSGETKTVAFNLSFTGSPRSTVADVTNAIASFYVAQNDQMRSAEASRTTQFLKEQVEEARAQLTKGDRQVEAYTRRNVGQLPQQVQVNLATLERLNTQLRLNGEKQMRTLDQREKLLEGAATALAVPNPANASTRDVRLSRFRKELAELEGFPDKHPDVRRLKAEIAVLEAEAAQGRPDPVGPRVAVPSGGRSVENLDNELDSLKSEEARLRQTIASFERRLEGVPYRENEFTALSRDRQATREQYESLLRRYEEAQLAESMAAADQGERFRIIEDAIPPALPIGPNRFQVLILGVVFGLAAAAMVMLLLEQADTSFHSVDDLRQFTRVPVLATIPRIGPAPGRNWPRTAFITASVLVGCVLAGTLSAYVARDNASIVRLLVRAS